MAEPLMFEFTGAEKPPEEDELKGQKQDQLKEDKKEEAEQKKDEQFAKDKKEEKQSETPGATKFTGNFFGTVGNMIWSFVNKRSGSPDLGEINKQWIMTSGKRMDEKYLKDGLPPELDYGLAMGAPIFFDNRWEGIRKIADEERKKNKPKAPTDETKKEENK